MRVLRSLLLLSLLALIPAAFRAMPRWRSASGSARWSPVGYDGGYGYGPPVCSYGYYPYYPYACSPYGYYGSSWFSGGIFIGAGPWYRGGWYGRGPWYGYGHGYYGHPGYGYGGRPIATPYRGGYNGYNGGHTAYAATMDIAAPTTVVRITATLTRAARTAAMPMRWRRIPRSLGRWLPCAFRWRRLPRWWRLRRRRIPWRRWWWIPRRWRWSPVSRFARSAKARSSERAFLFWVGYPPRLPPVFPGKFFGFIHAC